MDAQGKACSLCTAEPETSGLNVDCRRAGAEISVMAQCIASDGIEEAKRRPALI